MKRRFYFTGCSTTYGDDLTPLERETVNWPVLISQHYNADHVNEAEQGNSNGNIVSQIIQNIGQYDRYYVQWTVASRFTLYHADTWHKVHFNKNLTHDYYGKHDYYRTFGKYYYTHWQPLVHHFIAWLEQIICLQSFFQQHNASYLMFTCMDTIWYNLVTDRDQFIKNFSELHNIKHINDDQIIGYHDQITRLLSLIDFNRFIDPRIFNAGMVRKFPLGPTEHTLTDGCRFMANEIIKFEGEHYENI